MVIEEYTSQVPYYEVGGELKKTVPFTIELREWLTISHNVGVVFYDTLEQIRSLAVHKHSMVCGCFENLTIYQYHELSVDTDDGDAVIQPHNVFIDQTGRWLLKTVLTAGLNELVFRNSKTSFPSVGNSNFVYIARNTGIMYLWNEATQSYDVSQNSEYVNPFFAFEIRNGHLFIIYAENVQPYDFYINTSGHLIYRFNS